MEAASISSSHDVWPTHPIYLYERQVTKINIIPNGPIRDSSSLLDSVVLYPSLGALQSSVFPIVYSDKVDPLEGSNPLGTPFAML